MSLPSKQLRHFLFSSFPAWGHTRAYCILAARIAKEHNNLIVTLLLSPNFLQKAEAEIAAEFGDDVSQETRQRVRVLSPCNFRAEDLFGLIAAMIQTYPTAYQALWDAKPVTCAQTGKKFDAFPAPDSVFLDCYASPQMFATRSISGTAVPIIGLVPLHASCAIRLYGPEHMGGNGDLGTKIEEEAIRTGVPTKDIGDRIFYHTEGKIIQIPGLPDMYDWEHFPQVLPFQANVSDVVKLAYGGLAECDAVFSLSSYDFEPASLDAMKSWISAQWNKEVYTIGPLIPSKPTKYSISLGNSPLSSEIEVFLNKSLEEYGPQSVVLISFGSIFWPTVSEYVEEVIEALAEKKIPFLVSYASPFAKLSDEILQRVNLSGIGLISQWLPQKFVLDHPATGWFITHAGQNSVLESLGSGVPMICWPFEFDQPTAAAHLSENLNIAIELVEVRTGERGMKPLRRHGRSAQGTRQAVGVEIREVLDMCRSDRGEALRRNAEIMKAKFARSWAVDGNSREDFNSFLIKYGIDLS